MPSLSVANHSESTGTVPVERDRCLESSVACHLPLALEGGWLVDYQAVLISHQSSTSHLHETSPEGSNLKLLLTYICIPSSVTSNSNEQRESQKVKNCDMMA